MKKKRGDSRYLIPAVIGGGLGLLILANQAKAFGVSGQSQSYNCVDGQCVAVQGTSGQYATLADCQAACGGGTAPLGMISVEPTIVSVGGQVTITGSQFLPNISYDVYVQSKTTNMIVQFNPISTDHVGNFSTILKLVPSAGQYLVYVAIPTTATTPVSNQVPITIQSTAAVNPIISLGSSSIVGGEVETVAVTGSGFSPTAQIRLDLVDSASMETLQTIVRSDSTGGFTATVQLVWGVTAAPPGSYILRATDSSGVSVGTNLTITVPSSLGVNPQLNVNLDQSGLYLYISGSGFSPNATVTIRIQISGGASQTVHGPTVLTDGNGNIGTFSLALSGLPLSANTVLTLYAIDSVTGKQSNIVTVSGTHVTGGTINPTLSYVPNVFTGTGFTPNGIVNMFEGASAVAYRADSSGRFNASVFTDNPFPAYAIDVTTGAKSNTVG